MSPIDVEKSHRTLFGIEFAPFAIPLYRRLETFTVALFCSLLFLAIYTICPLFVYLFFTKYWLIPVSYCCWIFYDRNTPSRGGRQLKWLRNSKIWNYYRDYFPVSLVKTTDLTADKNYLFVVHPHGITSFAAMLNFQSNATNFDQLYPGIHTRLVALDANFRIPVARDIWLSVGAIGSNKESILNGLNDQPGKSCVIVVGGMKETLLSSPGDCICVLKNRKGFVKVALESGASLVPVFSFGENDVYDQIRGAWISSFQEFLRKFTGIPPCMIKGRGFFQYTFGLLPQRRPLTTVVGAPIKTRKIQNPSSQQVDEYHQKYINALVSLFDEYKEKYHVNGKRAKLQMV